MHVTRRSIICAPLALPLFAADRPAPPPNIVLVTTENVPAWVLGCYGNKEIRTPNLDRLAQMGTRFQRHVSCAPAPDSGLASLLTGRTPMQLRGASGSDSLEKALNGAGYLCASADQAQAVTILDTAAPGKPLFLHVRLAGPHAPYEGIPQKHVDLYAKTLFQTFAPEPVSPRVRGGKELVADVIPSQRKYAAAVTALDEQVQTVVAKVYQRKLQDQTAIIFTSGCGALIGRHGLWGAADSSEPPNLYEESVVTPLVWSWVGDVPAQAVRPEVVGSYDLLPTLLDIAGAQAPGQSLCGRSYRLLVTGKPLPRKEPWPTTVFAQHGNTEMARIERYKVLLRDQGKGPGELYDLRTDAGERTNQYDNPEYVSIRNSLTAEIHNWRQKYSA